MRSSCVPIMETGARWQGLNVEDMDSVYIPVPPINELNEIVRYLKESFSKINIAISIHRHQMLMLINNTIEPLYMKGPNPLGPIESSVRTLFSGFEFMITKDMNLRNNLFPI